MDSSSSPCQTPSGQASPLGSSGSSPNPHNESCFVANEAPGILDFPHPILNPGQLLTVCIETTRCVGTVDFDGFLTSADQHIQQGTLAATLLLTIRAQISAIDPQGSMSVEVFLHKGTDREKSLGFLQGAGSFGSGFQDFQLDVDVRDVKFPADPCFAESKLPCGRAVEPRSNQITFEFTGSIHGSMGIRMTVDWLMLEPKDAAGLAWHPVLLVHGLGVNSDSMVAGTAWANGLRARDIAYDAVDLTPKGSIVNNGAELAQWVEDVKRRLGVERVHMVGHSKGGIDAREYARRHDDVEVLVMLGAPNAGSFIANVTAVTLGASGQIGEILGGSFEMGSAFMLAYNFFWARNPLTTYVTAAGDHDAPWANKLAVLFGPNDEVTSVSSVEALSYAQAWTYLSSDGLTQHSGLRYNTTIVDDIFAGHLAVLTAPLRVPGPARLQTRRRPVVDQTGKGRQRGDAGTGAPAGVRVNVPAGVQGVMSTAGVASEGIASSHPAGVDDVDAAIFVMVGDQDALRFEIVSPGGRRIDAATPLSDASVTYTSARDAGSLSYAGYHIEAPEIGNWTLEVTGMGTSSPDASAYALAVLVPLTPGEGVVLTARIDQERLALGGTVTITATITEDGAPVTDATAKATILHPDRTTATEVVLLDDGAGADPLPGDGEYTGVFTSTTEAGLYVITVSALRTAPAFAREHVLLATVAQSSTAFSGAVSDRGADIDGDGFYDQLVIDVEVDVDVAAAYLVSGTLTDGAGTDIDQARVEKELQPGAQTVSLAFDGASLFALGHDGSYVVEDLVLEELSTAIGLDRNPSYTTNAYAHTEFQRPAILLTGTTSDHGAHSVHMEFMPYEELIVEVEVDMLEGATVQAGAKLFSEDGTFVAAKGTSALLPAGRTMLAFHFTAHQIFGSGKPGPYTLQLLTISGTTVSVPPTSPGGTPVSLRAPGVVAVTQAYALEDFAESPRYTVGGTVTGLVGAGLTLEISATGPSGPTTVPLRPTNGAFTFRVPTLVTGNPYEVRVTRQPANPVQVCSVVNGTGNIGTANVTDVVVQCVAPPPS